MLNYQRVIYIYIYIPHLWILRIYDDTPFMDIVIPCYYTSFTGWWCNFTILKNDGLRQWGWDDIPYMKWKITHVPNHQPAIYIYTYSII